MLSVRLPPELEARLAALSARTGRSRSHYARLALAACIDDLEAAEEKAGAEGASAGQDGQPADE